jgi:hypothetical protein
VPALFSAADRFRIATLPLAHRLRAHFRTDRGRACFIEERQAEISKPKG